MSIIARRLNKTFGKFFSILEYREKNIFFIVFPLILIGVILEMFSISLFIPLLSLFSTDINYESNKFISYLSSYLIFNDSNSKDYYFKVILILIAIFFLIKTIFFSLSIWFQSYFAFRVHTNFSKRIFKKYLNEDYPFFLNSNSAILIRNCFTEIEKLIRGVMTPAMMLITEIFVVAGLSSILLIFEPLGFIITFIYFAFTVIIFLLVTKKKLYFWGKKIQEIDGTRLKYLQQSFGAIKEIKLFGKEIFFYNIYKDKLKTSNSIYTRVATISQLPRFWLEYIVVTGLIILIFILFYLGSNTDQIIPIIGLFAIVAFRLLPSVNRIVNSLQSLRFNSVVIDVLYEELMSSSSKMNKKINETANVKKIDFKNIIKIENVDFSYENESNLILKDFNLDIIKGESLGIVGKSGVGKTTLLDIILGLLTPKKGTVKIDNISISDNLNNWQNQIGYVPQNSYLIDDTLERNIALGINDDEIDIKNLNKIIERSQLKDFVNNLKYGLKTKIGEKGVKISGGQRQRISIARALYNNPSILIFDEATNALDNITENRFINSIKSLKNEKTIIFVSHNKNILSFCDKIYDISEKKYIK